MAEHNSSQDPKKLPDKLKEWQKSQTEAYRVYIRTSAVGLEFGLSIAVGALLGYFIDKYFHSAPYGLVIGMVVGSIAAGKRLWLFVKDYVEKNRSHDDKK